MEWGWVAFLVVAACGLLVYLMTPLKGGANSGAGSDSSRDQATRATSDTADALRRTETASWSEVHGNGHNAPQHHHHHDRHSHGHGSHGDHGHSGWGGSSDSSSSSRSSSSSSSSN